MLAYILIAALVFGLCFGVDKGFQKLFRSRTQHKSGKALRLNKRYAAGGVVLLILGLLGVLAGISQGKVLLVSGSIVLLMGIALLVYYLTFGIFYDEDTFLVCKLGKESKTYRFEDIRFQLLYEIQGGNLLVELYLKDGGSVSVQGSMDGAYPFLDHAFTAWCRQTGRDPETCEFHDPAQGKWFPAEEEA